MQVIESILADAAQIAALRRDIHAHPELCFEEQRTSDLVAEQLTDWGIPIHRGLGTTGVVGIVKNGTSDARRRPARRHGRAADHRAQHLRARAARTPGKMHACGHDGHTAMLLGRGQAPGEAPQLRRHRLPDLPAGRRRRRRRARDDQGRPVREVPDGGGVRRAQLARHDGRPVRASSPGPAFASSNEFRIIDPRQGLRTPRCRTTASTRCRSPARWCRRFQTIISRNKRPIDAGVISVTMIHAGEATNVVPDSCEIAGHGAHLHARGARPDRAAHAGRSPSTPAPRSSASCEFEFKRNYPPTINHPAETEFARRVMTDMVGADNVLEFEPTMGAEDFSFFLQEKPGCYFLIGNGDGSAPRGRPRHGPLHAAQPELRLQRRADPARRARSGCGWPRPGCAPR